MAGVGLVRYAGIRNGGRASSMDIYHIWFERAEGVRDLELVDALEAYLGRLRAVGEIAGYRITRRKLGFGPADLGEFHVMIETESLAQLEDAFQSVAARADPVESLHAAVIGRVKSVRFALYRDFPDPGRKRGGERF